MTLDQRLKRTIQHGAPRPDLPNQNHDLVAAVEQLLSRLDAVESVIADLQAEEPGEEEEL